MKKATMFLICFFLTMPVSLSMATDQENCCQTIDQIMDGSAKEYRQMSQTIMEEYIKEPDTFSIMDCLGAINSINLGFSFGLPSLDELLKKACAFAKGQIDSKLKEAASRIEQQYSFGAYGLGAAGNLGVGSNGTNDIDFEVKDTSGEIVDSIWRSIQ